MKSKKLRITKRIFNRLECCLENLEIIKESNDIEEIKKELYWACLMIREELDEMVIEE